MYVSKWYLNIRGPGSWTCNSAYTSHTSWRIVIGSIGPLQLCSSRRWWRTTSSSSCTILLWRWLMIMSIRVVRAINAGSTIRDDNLQEKRHTLVQNRFIKSHFFCLFQCHRFRQFFDKCQVKKPKFLYKRPDCIWILTVSYRLQTYFKQITNWLTTKFYKIYLSK